MKHSKKLKSLTHGKRVQVKSQPVNKWVWPKAELGDGYFTEFTDPPLFTIRHISDILALEAELHNPIFSNVESGHEVRIKHEWHLVRRDGKFLKPLGCEELYTLDGLPFGATGPCAHAITASRKTKLTVRLYHQAKAGWSGTLDKALKRIASLGEAAGQFTVHCSTQYTRRLQLPKNANDFRKLFTTIEQ